MYSKQTPERDCKALESWHQCSKDWASYNSEIRFELVETEDILNAGHWVDPESATQACAETMGIVDMRNVRSADGTTVRCFLLDCLKALLELNGLSASIEMHMGEP